MTTPEEHLPYDDAVSQLCSTAWPASDSDTASAQTIAILRPLLSVSRQEEGRLKLGATPGAIPNLVRFLHIRDTLDEKAVQLAIRILRNLCVRSSANQARAASADGHRIVLSALAEVLQPIDGETMTGDLPSSLSTPFFGFAVEFLVNFVTGNESNAELVWAIAFPNVIDKLLRCPNQAAAAAAGALVHNCVTAAPHRMPDLVACLTPKNSQTDGESEETSLLHTLVSLMQSKGSDVEDDEENDEKFAWSFNIIRRLIRASMMRHCFETLGPSLDEIVVATRTCLTPLQTTFLHIVDAGVGRSAESGGESELECFSVPENGIPFFSELMEASFFKQNGTLLRVVASIVGSIVIVNENSDALDELRVNAVRIAVSVLQAITIKEQACGHDAAVASEGDGGRAIASVDGIDIEERRGLKGMMVRLIAVCADDCSRVQDVVRKVKGIPFVMNALSYEKDVTANPFLREWAVLAVRNLTLGNEENAKEISSYELVGVQNDRDLLEKAGLEAFLDSESGRPRLRQKNPPPQRQPLQ